MPPELISSHHPNGLENCAANTDREIWRQTPGEFYSPSIHVTEKGAIGIQHQGTVQVKTIGEWARLADYCESLNAQPALRIADLLEDTASRYEDLTATIGRLEIVIQEAAESICDAIESFANRMCEHPGVECE